MSVYNYVSLPPPMHLAPSLPCLSMYHFDEIIFYKNIDDAYAIVYHLALRSRSVAYCTMTGRRQRVVCYNQ